MKKSILFLFMASSLYAAHDLEVDIGGTVGLDTSYTRDTMAKSSDVAIGEARLNFSASYNDTSLFIELLHEDLTTDTDWDLDIDTAIITHELNEIFTISGGSGFVPFGNDATNFITDTLTRSSIEMTERYVDLTVSTAGFSADLYIFNGDLASNSGNEDHIEDWGAKVAYSHETDSFGLGVDLSYTSSFGEADAIESSYVGSSESEGVSGLSFGLNLAFGDFGLDTEYVMSLDDFAQGDIAYKNAGAEISALNAELHYSLNLFDKDHVFALGWQTSDEAVGLGFDRRRYGVAWNMGINEHSSLALEVLHSDRYNPYNCATTNRTNASVTTCGNGSSSDSYTLRWSYSI